jgi:ATP-dependent Lhr-like helicase
MNRIVSISFYPRMDLPWMIDPERLKAGSILLAAEDPNGATYQILKEYGALFFPEIMTKVKGLESELQDQLSELSRRGLIHADGFGAIRDLVQKSRSHSSSHRSPAMQGGLKGRLRARFSQRSSTGGGAAMMGGGRWSLFPPPLVSLTEPDPETRAYQWAEVLLKRYGVVFKALLGREQAAPAWGLILRALRLMEARGEVRGGQFVAGPWGEQFAKEETIARLRSFRGKTGLWAVVHAADPLNLIGTLLNRVGERVSPTHRVVLGIVDGEVVAKRQGTEVVFLKAVAPPLESELRQSLLLMGSFRSQLWQRSRR